MKKAEWLWVGRYTLVIGGAFLAEWSMRGWVHPHPEVMTALSPEDCAIVGKKPTGWQFQVLYHGGINNGGASSMITYECR